jgi:serine/threonine protein kinase
METREPAVDWSGTILDDRYQLLEQLGGGGMGHVYAATHLELGQRVAIKVLHPRLAEDERFRARFLQEAHATSRIRHPNVVEIKDSGRAASGTVYFVMEYLRGRDLSVELLHQGTLPWSRARNILVQAASALQAAHANQIIHRDIKPGNCFLLDHLDHADAGLSDVVKLVDFGIAKVGDPSSRGLTGAGEIIGTVSYMSPEQARSEPLDARSDVYSLGAMAYEMLTGLVPFRGDDALCVIAALLQEQPEPVRRLAPQVPAAADAMVLKMLAKAPQDRYASMAAVVEALQSIPETARGARSTRLWSPGTNLRASEAPEPEPASPPTESVAGGPAAERVGSSADDRRTTLLQPEGSADRGRIGAWPATPMGAASRTVSVTSSTEPQRRTNDTLVDKARSWEPMRLSPRRFAGLALFGLLVLLAGSTVLVARAWGSNDGMREPPEGTAAPRDARAAGQHPAIGERGSSR